MELHLKSIDLKYKTHQLRLNQMIYWREKKNAYREGKTKGVEMHMERRKGKLNDEDSWKQFISWRSGARFSMDDSWKRTHTLTPNPTLPLRTIFSYATRAKHVPHRSPASRTASGRASKSASHRSAGTTRCTAECPTRSATTATAHRASLAVAFLAVFAVSRSESSEGWKGEREGEKNRLPAAIAPASLIIAIWLSTSSSRTCNHTRIRDQDYVLLWD